MITHPSSRGWSAIAVGSLLVLCLVAHGAGLRNGFVWDDQALIVQNESIKSWHNLGVAVSSDFFGFDRSPIEAKQGYYRPLVTVSYMVDYAVWQLNASGYHLTNLALHACCTLMVFFLFRLLAGSGTAAWLIAALFAAHPIHTEAVTWIAGRADVLCSLFVLLALYGYVRRASYDRETGGTARAWTAVSWVAFALALFSKETALVIPLVLLLHELVVRPSGRASGRHVVVCLLPYIIITAGYLVLRFVVLGVAGPANQPLAAYGRIAIVATFVKAIALYVGMSLVPWPLVAYRSLPVVGPGDPVVLGMLVGALLAAVVMWRYRQSLHLAAFSALLFVTALLPVSNMVPIGAPRDMGFVVAERFLYLPSVGLCALVGSGIWAAATRLSSHAGRRLLPFALVAPVLAGYVTASTIRAADWRDDPTFYRATLEHAPYAAALHYNVALVLWDNGERAQAERELREAIRRAPEYSDAHNNLGNILYLRGDLRSATEQWALAARANPSNCQAWMNLARALDRQGRWRESVGAYQQFLRTAPPSMSDLMAEARGRLNALAPLVTVTRSGR